MRSKTICALLSALMIAAATGCSVNSNEKAASSAAGAEVSSAPADGNSQTGEGAEADTSAAEAPTAESSEAVSDENDEKDPVSAVNIKLNGSSAEIDAGAAGVTAEGSVITITAAGDYSFSGSLDDGQIIVNAAKTDKVDIYLNNVSVSSSTNAPVRVEQADGVTLHLAEGTVNSFADTSANPNTACISAKDDLTIKGKGTLNVTGAAKHAIKSSNDVKIKNGVLNLSAVAAGIYGEDKVQLTGGTITVSTCKDGIKAVIDEGDTESEGIVTAENTVVDIQNASGNGIEATKSVTVTSGSIKIHSTKKAINCNTQSIAEGTVSSY